MPTLFRFLTIIAITAGLAYAAMFALATFVEPRRVQMSVPVPIDGIDPQPTASPEAPEAVAQP